MTIGPKILRATQSVGPRCPFGRSCTELCMDVWQRRTHCIDLVDGPEISERTRSWFSSWPKASFMRGRRPSGCQVKAGSCMRPERRFRLPLLTTRSGVRNLLGEPRLSPRNTRSSWLAENPVGESQRGFRVPANIYSPSLTFPPAPPRSLFLGRPGASARVAVDEQQQTFQTLGLSG